MSSPVPKTGDDFTIEQWMELGKVFESQVLNFQELACMQRVLEKEPYHWQARYRELVVLFWIRHEGQLPEIFDRFFSDLYAHRDQMPLDVFHACNLNALCMYLFYVYSMPEASDRDVLAYYAQKADLRAAPWQKKLTAKDRLRIGYMGREFERGSCMQILLPFLENHTGRVEVHIYDDSWSEIPRHRIRELGDKVIWHNTSEVPNPELIEQIRKDKIDVLVDVAGPTFLIRNEVFYSRSAPVQVGGMGFVFSSAKALDYCLTDPVLTPPEVAAYYPEPVKYLPTIFQWKLPKEHERQHPDNEQLVLGASHTLNKLNAPLLAIWAELIRRLPGAILYIKTGRFSDPATRDMYIALFKHHGIPEAQLRLEGYLSQHEHLPYFYNQIDIALDSFPYQGAITTCDALFMGVPVVSLRTPQWQGRALGATILDHVGLSEWVARDVEDYYHIVLKLARDKARRRALRFSLRDTLKNSIVCQPERYTRVLEDAYFEMYEDTRRAQNDA